MVQLDLVRGVRLGKDRYVNVTDLTEVRGGKGCKINCDVETIEMDDDTLHVNKLPSGLYGVEYRLVVICFVIFWVTYDAEHFSKDLSCSCFCDGLSCFFT